MRKRDLTALDRTGADVDLQRHGSGGISAALAE